MEKGVTDRIRLATAPTRAAATAPPGPVLCVAPAGSGKTTTLYAALSEIATPEDKIITIEDPVEYKSETISQIQVHEKVGLTFASALRSIDGGKSWEALSGTHVDFHDLWINPQDPRNMIVANDVSKETGVMGGDRNAVHLVTARGV